LKKYLIIILTTICALLLTLFAFLLLVPNGISIPGLHIAKKVSAPTNSYWTRLADQKQKAEEQKELKRLTEGNLRLSPEELLTYGDVVSCSIQENKETVTLSLSLPDIPGSDDADIYLFALETYESEAKVSLNERIPVSQTRKAISCEFEWNYSKEMLFQHFVPALLLEGSYVPIATGNYINNPEMVASNCDNYPENTSKKGLLIDPFTLGTPEYDKLGIKYVIYNIPFSHILGETTDAAYPTINYEYQGRTYLFNGLAIAAYDNLFQTLTDNNQIVTAIVLDDWNEIYPEAIHPQSRNKNPDAYYYAMNTADAEGCRLLQAVASFLTERSAVGNMVSYRAG